MKLFVLSMIGVGLLCAQTGRVENKWLKISSVALNFNDQLVGQQSSHGANTITNAGNSPLRIQSVTVEGSNASDFTILKDECTDQRGRLLGPEQSCSVYVSFKPGTTGKREAKLSIQTDANATPRTVLLGGHGVTAGLRATVTGGVLTADQFELFFTSQGLGTSSGPETVNITNSSTSTVTGATFAIVGANAGDYTLHNNCSSYAGSIPAGATCSVQISFTPEATGTRSGTLAITSSAAEVSVALSGVGASDGLQFVPASLSFAAATGTSGVTAVVNIQNAGTVPATITNFYFNGPTSTDYSIAGYTCPGGPTLTIPPGISCEATFLFKPGAVGARADSFVLVSAAGTQTLALNGVGESLSKTISVTPASSLSFATTGETISSAPQSITIQNTGTAAVTFKGFAIGGGNAGDFFIETESNTCLAGLPAGESCVVPVIFTPSSTGSRMATLTISDDAAGSTQTIALSGTGSSTESSLIFQLGETIFNPELTFYNYGDVVVGGSQTDIFSLENTSLLPITFSGYATVGANATDFVITQGSGLCSSSTVLSGSQAACLTDVTFLPSAAGARTAMLQVSDNAPGGAQSIPLFGYGVPAASLLEFGNTAYDFGTSNVGAAVQSTSELISNLGSVPLTIWDASFTGSNAGDFTVSSVECPTGLTLQVNGYCLVTFAFKPSAAGIRTATFNVIDTAPGSPHTISLSGVGVTTPVSQTVSVSPSVLDLGVSVIGTPVASGSSIHFTNNGTANVNLSALTVSGGSAADFHVYQSSCGSVLAGGASCDVYVQFDPSAAGVRMATLTLTDNASGGATAVSLYGLGEALANAFTVTPNGTVYNTGNTPLTVFSTLLSGTNAGDFSVAKNTCTSPLAAGVGECQLTIQFSPTATGLETATLYVVTSAGTASVALNAGSPIVFGELIPDSSPLSFPATPVGTSNTQADGFTNIGTGNATINTVAITGANAGDFSIAPYNGCFASFVARSTDGCTAYVTFTPTVRGLRTANLVITDSTAGSPHVIVLSGVGQ